jgi:hypothetical protein
MQSKTKFLELLQRLHDRPFVFLSSEEGNERPKGTAQETFMLKTLRLREWDVFVLCHGAWLFRVFAMYKKLLRRLLLVACPVLLAFAK